MLLCLTFLSEENILHTLVAAEMVTWLDVGRGLMINILKEALVP